MPKPLAVKAVLGPVVVFGLSCAVFSYSTWVVRMPPAWYTFEFCQYAEIGRNLAAEGTFDTRLVEPMALAYIDAHRVGPPGPRWPVVNRYPLPCLVIAALMRAFGATDAVAAWSNGLAVGGVAVLTYALARSWYGGRWAALAAVLVFANPSFYGTFILLGTPDVWFALCFGLELLAWSALAEAPGRRVALAALTGGLLGLAYLARFNVLAFAVPQGAALCARRRWGESAVMAAATAAVAAPVLAYNVCQFGRPFVGIYSAWNLLDGVGAYRVEPWLYYRVPDVAGELWGHLGGFAAKFVTNLALVVPRGVWSLWHLELVLPLAAAGVLVPGTGPPGAVGRRFLAWAAGLFLFQLVLFSALRLELGGPRSSHHGRYFFWFAAPAVLLGVGTLRRLMGRSWPLGTVATAAVVAGQLALFGGTWSGWTPHGKRTNLGRDPIRKALPAFVAEGQVIASNQPQLTAWFCDRRSVSLPADPDELGRLNRSSPTPIDYVLIDMNFNAIVLDERWKGLTTPEASPWERALLREYEYVMPPESTRPFMYVLLRRRSVAPSRLERSLRADAEG
jgi:hypothetical protein